MLNLKKLLGYLKLEGPDTPIGKVSVDSKECSSDALFVALKGNKVDGHQFLQEAKERGASSAIVSKDYIGDDHGLFLIKVTDPLCSLQLIAKRHLENFNGKVIGITGSVGKTTTKDFISHLLSQKFKVCKTQKSMNGQIGVPLTILNSDESADFLVLEMGMSQKGEMDRLIEMAPIDIGVCNKVAPVHIENFASLEEIAFEKSRIFSSKKLVRGFSHPDNFEFLSFSNMSKKIEKISCNSSFHTDFIEEHLIENFNIAFHVAAALGVEEELIEQAAKTLQGAPHRFEKTIYPNDTTVTIIDDTYNSNPLALKSALKSAQKYKTKRVIGVIGEMKELGEMSSESHFECGVFASNILDEVYCYGELTAPFYEAFKSSGKKGFHFVCKKELSKKLKESIQSFDVVFLKASNSNRLWEVIESVKNS